MDSLGEVFPILKTANRAERAILRGDRAMAYRQNREARVAHIELKDGLAITVPELERLTTCHRIQYRRLDWRAIAARPLAATPVRAHEDLAAFQQACTAVAIHNTEVLTARKLLDGDAIATREVIVLNTRLAELRDGMNSLGIAVPEEDRLVAVVDAIEEGDVPYERITDGDLRTARREPIPLAERRQIHLAALCAAALRVGAELVGVLPEEAIEVVVHVEMLSDDRTESLPRPVLQLLMTTEALKDLDWKAGDAITLATSLGARMDWSIERGFAPISIAPLSSLGRPLAKSA
ncbi:hypothetical protein LJR225_000372 [Phenylobacterium sp. LjRoot225]|uniref:hypothetical protein n=1 Tax=Phenylobacterium sp. LjRoot225 TaxID=3342285 RepID=UPI003ECF0503